MSVKPKLEGSKGICVERKGHLSYTQESKEIQREIANELEDVFLKYRKEGYLPNEIQFIMSRALNFIYTKGSDEMQLEVYKVIEPLVIRYTMMGYILSEIYYMMSMSIMELVLDNMLGLDK